VTEAEITTKQRTTRRFDSILGAVGRVLIATGVLMLLFVAYQLWGTGLSEQRAQSDLQRTFTSQLPSLPLYGDPVTRIEISKIGVDKIVVAGVDYKALEKGPGLFDGSPLPGQLGNVAIAGHRTSYGAPFSRLNELTLGDEIVLTRAGSTFTYIVSEKPFIVKPSQTEVLKTIDATTGQLTLVTCHPKWTSENRMIVKAKLESSVTPQPATVFSPASVEVVGDFNAGWFREPDAIPGAVLLAVVLLLMALVAMRLVSRGRTAWVVYPVTAVVFLPVLFVFFGYLSRLLPANI
jgi:sortase A